MIVVVVGIVIDDKIREEHVLKESECKMLANYRTSTFAWDQIEFNWNEMKWKRTANRFVSREKERKQKKAAAAAASAATT